MKKTISLNPCFAIGQTMQHSRNGVGVSLRVVCAVIEQRGCIMAARRSSKMPYAGKWEFPGGKVQQGESDEAALMRELHEELGLLKIMIRLALPVVRRPGIELVPFLCSLQGETAKPLEHDLVRWIRLVDAEQLDWLEPDIDIIKSALDAINGAGAS